MVPLYIARVADLRVGQTVSVKCRSCGHVPEIGAVLLRERLPEGPLHQTPRPEFRCERSGFKGAEVDARRALGRYG